MQRRLDELLSPKTVAARPKRVGPMPAAGVLGYATGVLELPVLPGATLAEQTANWERMAATHCAKLMNDSREDME